MQPIPPFVAVAVIVVVVVMCKSFCKSRLGPVNIIIQFNCSIILT